VLSFLSSVVWLSAVSFMSWLSFMFGCLSAEEEDAYEEEDTCARALTSVPGH